VKINGWQRIGIIASAGWVIWSYNHTFDRLAFRDARIAVDKEQNCLSAHPGEFDKYFLQCDALSPENESELTKQYHDNEIEAITEALIPVPLAWGGVYLALFFFRWVRKGFSN
jgi:hypothetical protein